MTLPWELGQIKPDLCIGVTRNGGPLTLRLASSTKEWEDRKLYSCGMTTSPQDFGPSIPETNHSIVRVVFIFELSNHNIK